MAGDDAARWLVLASFSFHAFCNQFMFMNFAESVEISKEMFKVDDADVNWLYSAGMLSAVPSFFLVMAFSESDRWTTSFIGISCTVVSAWVRVLAVSQHNFALAVASSAFLGPGTALICTGFADLPMQLFPHGLKRKVTAGIAVQSTFLGWGMGGLLAALLIKSVSILSSFVLVQAVLVSVSLPVFLFVHNQPLEPLSNTGECVMLGRDLAAGYGAEGEQGSGGGADGGLTESIPAKAPMGMLPSFGAMLSNWRFILQASACAVLQGVGYTLPAVQEAVFATRGFTSLECATSGFVFIMAGVVLGMILASPLAPSGKAPRLVLAFFWIGTLAVVMLQQSVSPQFANIAGSHQGAQIIHLCLMIVGGGCTLGFLNITLPVVCAEVHPVSEVYSGGMIELLAFGLGALLTQWSTDGQFKVCAGASFVSAFLMTVSTMFPGAPREEPETSSTSPRASAAVEVGIA